MPHSIRQLFSHYSYSSVAGSNIELYDAALVSRASTCERSELSPEDSLLCHYHAALFVLAAVVANLDAKVVMPESLPKLIFAYKCLTAAACWQKSVTAAIAAFKTKEADMNTSMSFQATLKHDWDYPDSGPRLAIEAKNSEPEMEQHGLDFWTQR